MKNKIKKASSFAFWASLLCVFALFGCAKPVNPVLLDNGKEITFKARKNIATPSNGWVFNISPIWENTPSSTSSRYYYFPFSDYSSDGLINGSSVSNGNINSFRFWFTFEPSLNRSYISLVIGGWEYYQDFYTSCNCFVVGSSAPLNPTRWGSGQWYVDGALRQFYCVSTFSGFTSYYNGLLNGHTDGYSSGYSEGYNDGVSDGYSSGYSEGYSTAQNLYKDNFILGRSLDGVIFPQYEAYTPEQAFNALYIGSPIPYTSKAVTFNDGSYLEYFKEAYPLGDSKMAMGYRYYSSDGVSYPLYYVVSDNASPYGGKEIHLSNYSNDIGFFRFRSVLDIGSLTITALDEGAETLNISVLSPSYDDGYSQGYKDGQEAPTNLPNDYAQGYAQGYADGNDGWNTIIPTIFASCGAFFYPWTTIEIFGISILGLFGILSIIGVVALCLKVFLK